MEFIADLHIHSKYSRATSPMADLDHIVESAKVKGIKIIGTGDFTHPKWIQEIEEKLEPAEQGLFKMKKSQDEIRFLLSSEISCIYKYKDKVRKVHNIIFSPSLEAVKKINGALEKIGNIHSDGRPIIGLNSKELLKIALEADENCLFVPAHCMTPWFAIFGSKSGFDSIEECFDEYSKYIFALETGLSANPANIWLIPDGRRVALISNSDAHSPSKLGREANVFNTELSYPGIIEAIKSKDNKKFLYTIEFFPQEGRYYYDGHRACDISLSPAESKRYNDICPVCGKPLTLGVMKRIVKLADKEGGFVPEGAIPFKSLIPLKEIIAEAFSCGPNTKKVNEEYETLIKEFNNEFNILLNVSEEDLKNKVSMEIIEGIVRVRQGKVNIEPGYDGVFGKIKIFSDIEKKSIVKQKVLI